MSRVLVALLVAVIGLGLNVSAATAAPCAPAPPAPNGSSPQPNEHRPAHAAKQHKKQEAKRHGQRTGKRVVGDQRDGLGASQDAWGSAGPQQATPPGEPLVPPVPKVPPVPPVQSSPAGSIGGSTGSGVLGAHATVTATVSRSRGRPAAAHANRPAAVAPVAVIHDVVRRMMQEAPPALDVFAAEAALATFPLLLIVLVLVGFILVQRLIDRGDPKLASNAKPDPLQPFT